MNHTPKSIKLDVPNLGVSYFSKLLIEHVNNRQTGECDTHLGRRIIQTSGSEDFKHFGWVETSRNPKQISNAEIPRFTSLIGSSKTARKAKTRKTKINFPLRPNGNNDRFARGRSSYKRKLPRKLKKKKQVLICASRISENS
jgi:hypothetical protein